jgi:hypothetical protein
MPPFAAIPFWSFDEASKAYGGYIPQRLHFIATELGVNLEERPPPHPRNVSPLTLALWRSLSQYRSWGGRLATSQTSEFTAPMGPTCPLQTTGGHGTRSLPPLASTSSHYGGCGRSYSPTPPPTRLTLTSTPPWWKSRPPLPPFELPNTQTCPAGGAEQRAVGRDERHPPDQAHRAVQNGRCGPTLTPTPTPTLTLTPTIQLTLTPTLKPRPSQGWCGAAKRLWGCGRHPPPPPVLSGRGGCYPVEAMAGGTRAPRGGLLPGVWVAGV